MEMNGASETLGLEESVTPRSLERRFRPEFRARGLAHANIVRLDRRGDDIEISALGGWINRPWETAYRARNYQYADPVVSELVRSDQAFFWSELPVRRGRLTRLETRVLAEARRFGVLEGFAASLRQPEGARLAVILTGGSGDIGGAAELAGLADDLLAQVSLSGVTPEPRRRLAETLKRRQTECLEWAAAGKTSQEIALILNLSRKTVDEHIENACKALDVNGRIHAVAKAVELGLISSL